MPGIIRRPRTRQPAAQDGSHCRHWGTRHPGPDAARRRSGNAEHAVPGTYCAPQADRPTAPAGPRPPRESLWEMSGAPHGRHHGMPQTVFARGGKRRGAIRQTEAGQAHTDRFCACRHAAHHDVSPEDALPCDSSIQTRGGLGGNGRRTAEKESLPYIRGADSMVIPARLASVPPQEERTLVWIRFLLRPSTPNQQNPGTIHHRETAPLSQKDFTNYCIVPDGML